MSDLRSQIVNVIAVILSACGLLAGCGPRVYQVQPDLARETLARALDHWKAGNAPQELQSANPPIVVQDMEWTSGWKLADYEVLDQGLELNASLEVRVKLDLVDDSDKEFSKTVTYLVTTSPVLTVFRNIFK